MLTLPFFFNKGERSPARRPWAVAWVVVVVLGVLGLWREGVAAPWSPRFQSPPLPNSLSSSASSAALHGQVLFHDKGREDCHVINGLGGFWALIVGRGQSSHGTGHGHKDTQWWPQHACLGGMITLMR